MLYSSQIDIISSVSGTSKSPKFTKNLHNLTFFSQTTTHFWGKIRVFSIIPLP